MTIRIAGGSKARLERSTSGFVVQVDLPKQLDRSEWGAAAVAALNAARTRLLTVEDPRAGLGLDLRVDRNEVPYVSSVVATPTGALMYVDRGHVSSAKLMQVLDWTVQELTAREITDAVVAVPTRSPSPDPDTMPRPGPCLTLVHTVPAQQWAGPVPPAPASWGQLAHQWLTGDSALTTQGLRATLSGQVVPLDAEDITLVLGTEGTAITTRLLSTGQPESGERFAEYYNGRCHVLVLGTTGVAGQDVDEVEQVLIDLAEVHAEDCDYAFVEIPNLTGLGVRTVGVSDRPDFSCLHDLLDQVAYDAFAYQILGPAHLTQIETPPGAHPLAGGRLAWRLSSLREWSDPDTAGELRAGGRQLLAPLLLGYEGLEAMSDALFDHHVRGNPWPASPTGIGQDTALDLGRRADTNRRDHHRPDPQQRKPSERDIEAFPWPQDQAPVAHQVARQWEAETIILRPVEEVLEEVSQAIRARGRLVGVARPSERRPWSLVGELNGQGYMVALKANSDRQTWMSVSTFPRWSHLTAPEKSELQQALDWITPPL